MLSLLAGGWCVWTHRLGVSDLDDAASNGVLFAREALSTILLDLKWADQSPLYFVVLHFWRALGESPGWIKGLNLVAVTAAVVLLYEVSRLVSGRRIVAVGTVALAVLSPATLWVVRNGRMYSLQLLLSVACLYCLVRYMQQGRPHPLAGFVVAAVLGLYNHFVGFVAAGGALLWLALEERAMADRALDRAGWRTLRWLAVPAATGLAILLLALPQVWRLAHLLGEAPRLIAGWSLPGSRVAFLDHLSWFWFINSDWGALRDWGTALRALYLVSAYLLFVAGLSDSTGRMARLALATVLVPVAAGVVAAAHVDLRHRYFVHILPVVWMAMANGALGSGGSPTGRPARVWAVGRRGLLAIVMAASAWLLVSKLPERYAEWAKLWSGLVQLGRPGMKLYMPPGPTVGTPSLLGSQHGTAGLAPIEPLSAETGARFLSEAAQGREFAFLAQANFTNTEAGWRDRHLRQMGYRRVVLPVWGARAQIYLRHERPAFSRVVQLRAEPSAREVVRWARTRSSDPSRPRPAASGLGRALVARVHGDGVVDESTFFISQRGESGYWRVGPGERDAVAEERVWTGRGEEEMLVARAQRDSLLVIAFPDQEMRRGLKLQCGGRDARPRVEVSAQVFVGEERVASVTCPVKRPWTEATLGTAGHEGRRAGVTVLLTAFGGDADLAFRLGPSARSGPPPRPPDGPIVMDASRPLSASVDRLAVHRTSRSGFGRLPSRWQPAALSAAETHEKEGPDGEGAGGALALGSAPAGLDRGWLSPRGAGLLAAAALAAWVVATKLPWRRTVLGAPLVLGALVFANRATYDVAQVFAHRAAFEEWRTYGRDWGTLPGAVNRYAPPGEPIVTNAADPWFLHLAQRRGMVTTTAAMTAAGAAHYRERGAHLLLHLPGRDQRPGPALLGDRMRPLVRERRWSLFCLAEDECPPVHLTAPATTPPSP